MRITIKRQTRTGKPAQVATEKQEKFASDIINRINAALDEIAATGYPQYADEAAAKFDKLTDAVGAGPQDVIDYLKNYEKCGVYRECYMMARRDKNFQAVEDLNPMNPKNR